MSAVILLIALLAGPVSQARSAPPTTFTNLSYDQLISEAGRASGAGKLDEALAWADQAMVLNSNRYEGYALGGVICLKQRKVSQVGPFLEKALELAPEAKREPLEKLQNELALVLSTNVTTKTPLPGANYAGPTKPSAEARRKLDILDRIVVEARNAKSNEARAKAWEDYLARSDDLILTDTNIPIVWMFRAAIGLELYQPRIAWRAGKQLQRLGATQIPTVPELLAELNRRHWLDAKPAPDDPKAFWVYLGANETADSLRVWLRESQGKWRQQQAGGRLSEFQKISTAVVDGGHGTIVRRMPDKTVDFFVPDVHALGRDPKMVRFRAAPSGVWQNAGEMHLVDVSVDVSGQKRAEGTPARMADSETMKQKNIPQ